MSEKKEKLFLLDAFALIYRAHFAFSNNPRINSKGVNTSVMFGFTNTLLEVLQKQVPSHIAVVFDTSAPTFRHEEYPEYKANRQETPEDIRMGTPYVKEIIRGFNIPIIELDGYEADDLIGTMAKRAEKKGLEVYMMTPDKDFGQLVSENIFLYKPAYMGNSVDIMGVDEVKAKWNIEHVDQLRDILGLQGDASDNIPGIPGIGPKTAAKLLAKYGTVEEIVAHAHELKGKQKELIEQYGDQGKLSKHLATIIVEAPIEVDFEEMRYSGPDEAKLQTLFQDLEFRTMARRLFQTAKETAPTTTGGAQLSMFDAVSAKKEEEQEAPPSPRDFSSLHNSIYHYHKIELPDERRKLLSFLEKQKGFSFETVTDDPNPFNAVLIGLAFSWYKGDAYFIPLNGDEAEKTKILEEFKDVFADPKTTKTAHNIKYDLLVFRRYGIPLEGPLFDTMLAHYLIEPDLPHTVESLSESYLHYSVSPDNIAYLEKNKRSKKVKVHEDLMALACEAADITAQLHEKLEQEIEDRKLKNLYYELEIPLLLVLATMEFDGVKIDEKVLGEMSVDLDKQCTHLQDSIFAIAGETFNINSPRQLGEILFDKLNLIDKPKKTKSGQYATGEEILSKLTEHQIVNDILEYREYQKLKSTYVDALPTMINSHDGRIHTSYSQAVAVTGRLSSVNPNLQNIPIRTGQGKLIRKAFISSSPEYFILSADYSQIELRIMASFSKDEHMINAFLDDRDIHAATAAKIFGVSLEEVDEGMRRKAKSVNFGLIYGQSAFGLAQNLNISRGEAKEIIDTYFNEFPSVKSYMDRVINEAREKEYVETIMGRRRYLRDINSRNMTMRGFAERNAINAPIQGSAADIIKKAMIDIHHWMSEKQFKTKMIMQVHDELVFEVHPNEREEIMEGVVNLMQHAVKIDVPMKVEAGIGKNWLEAH
ncbi:MAG: DNA polymerase I [Cyclobacteriaceae bacterium]|nr:DNA polymerase I [Cyclobacteriaceae bacterium]